MARSIERYLRMMPKASNRGLRCSENFWYPAPDELSVEINGDILRVSGVRRDETLTEMVSYQQLEITYSRFEKTIRFPCPVEGAAVERRYRDGLLILYIRSPAECD